MSILSYVLITKEHIDAIKSPRPLVLIFFSKNTNWKQIKLEKYINFDAKRWFVVKTKETS